MNEIINYFKDSNEIKIKDSEIYRYLGYRGVTPDEATAKRVANLKQLLLKVSGCRACFSESEVSFVSDDILRVFSDEIESKSLQINLRDCEKAFVFSATIGMGFDMQLKRLTVCSAVDAVIFDCIGSAAIEAFCDDVNSYLYDCVKVDNMYLRPRYSVGYGDFALKHQPQILDYLDARRRVGITLNSALLMVPTKSVTAVVGITDEVEKCGDSCIKCDKEDCQFRK